MSINRNRAKLKKAETNREYRLVLMHVEYNYCYICQKRAGSFFANCSPANMHAKGRHGSGRRIFRHKYREFKTWKYNRNKQWKEKNLNSNKG